MSNKYTLGIDIGSTTVKIAILDENDTLLFADYQRHFANIQETLAELLAKAYGRLRPRRMLPSSLAAKMPRSSISKAAILSSV